MNVIGQDYRIIQPGTVRLDVTQRTGRPPVVLSFGKGLDSVWTGVRLFTSNDPYWTTLREDLALILTSELGAEWPETNQHFHEVMIPFFRAHDWEVTILVPRVKDRHGVVHETITDYYIGQGIIPTRRNRSCTDRFKINPLQHASRDILQTKQFTTALNFDAGEGKRVERAGQWKTRSYIYPPYEAGMTRAAMTRELEQLGFPVPRKSACTFCMWSSDCEMKDLSVRHPELMAEANIRIEENMHQVRGRTDLVILRSGRTMRQVHEERLYEQRLAAQWWPGIDEEVAVP